MASETWVDLLDPSEDEIVRYLDAVPPGVVRVLERPSTGDADRRPTVIGLPKAVVGMFLVPVLEHDGDDVSVFYQEVDLVLTRERLLTVRKTPGGDAPFDLAAAREAARDDDSTGVLAYRLANEVAEAYLALVDELNNEIDELDDHVEDWKPGRVRTAISHVRRDVLSIRRTLGPTRDAVRQIADNRVDTEGEELFDHRAELAFNLVYDKLLRASEELDYSRDQLAGVRDYSLAKIANDQNQVVQRLTVAATLLLVPTFIVGVYGMNFRHIPELRWRFGYAYCWALIVVTTLLQLVYYRRKRWV